MLELFPSGRHGGGTWAITPEIMTQYLRMGMFDMIPDAVRIEDHRCIHLVWLLGCLNPGLLPSSDVQTQKANILDANLSNLACTSLSSLRDLSA